MDQNQSKKQEKENASRNKFKQIALKISVFNLMVVSFASITLHAAKIIVL